MSHLLHIDSSVRGEVSVSRRLTARAADRWRGAHPGGTVTYRDLGTNPIPHLDAATGLARMVAAEQRTAAEDASFALTAELTTADANPKMAHLKPLAADSLNNALAAIDQLWTASEDAA